MSLTFTKRQIASLAEVLDKDYSSAFEAAEAALAAAHEIIIQRARFTVVGQVKTKTGDPPGDKIALGWYATEGQATQDALKLTYSVQTHEEHRAWVLPIFNGTPNAYYVERKKRFKMEDLANKSFRERELARRSAWLEANPDEPIPEDWGLIPFDAELTDCPMCDGSGKLKK